LAFGNATHGRVAAHLSNLVHIHRNETGLGTQIGSSGGGFATGMAGTYYNNIVLKIH
jgi:hypothetical protein